VPTLEGKTIFVSGASRGIGLAIALRAARDGANVALIAKTNEPHPKLEGTVHTAAGAIEEAGGRAVPIVGDIREEEQVEAAVQEAVAPFGGIDVAINNASAINLAGTEALELKRYDLMQDVNTRGAFVVSKHCVPHLRRAENPHVLTLSPPLGPQVGRHLPRVHARQVRDELLHARNGRGGCHRSQPVLLRRRGVRAAGRPLRRSVRAIQVSEFGGPEVLELREVGEPEVPQGAELVEVSAAGVNYADTHQAENS